MSEKGLTEKEIIERLQQAHMAFQAIRWDWSDPRYKCRAGMNYLAQVLKHFNSEPLVFDEESYNAD